HRQYIQALAVFEGRVEIQLGDLVQDDYRRRQRQPMPDTGRTAGRGGGFAGCSGSHASGLLARFARAEQVADTTAADLRMVGMAAHIQAPMPAALAFLVRRGRDFDAQLALAGMYGCARDNQDETQVVAQT